MLHRFLKPAEITVLYLFFLYLLAVLLKDSRVFFFSELFRMFVLSLSFVAPLFFLSRYRKQKIHWDNLAITLCILLLLADHTTSLGQTVLLGLLASASKITFRIHRHPIFNPAAIALFCAYFLGVTTTWWGVSFAPRFTQFELSSALFFTLPLGVYIMWKYQKMPTILGTTAGLICTNLFFSGSFPTLLLLEGTYAFFLFLMATEPKTTPLIDSQEWWYGLALGASLAVWFWFKLPLPYLSNLLILNGAFSIWRVLQLKRVQRQARIHSSTAPLQAQP